MRHTSFITFFRLSLRLLDHYGAAGENMCASTFLVFYFVLNCASSLSSFAAQTTPAASINKTFCLQIIEFFFQLQSCLCILATSTSSIIHLIWPSKFCYGQNIRPLESGDPGYLPFTWENRKFCLENEWFATFRLETFRKYGL